MSDLSRTSEQLSREKRALLEDLTRITDPDQNYKAYHKRIKKLRAANYIPWCSKFTSFLSFSSALLMCRAVAELHAVNYHLLEYPPTVNEESAPSLSLNYFA
jgi:hypothetical protein